MVFFVAVFSPAERDAIERGREGGQEGGQEDRNVIWWRHAYSCLTR
mgnify:FL=1